MLQHRDGSFGEVMPVDEAFDELKKAMLNNTAKSFFLGDKAELEGMQTMTPVEKEQEDDGVEKQ